MFYEGDLQSGIAAAVQQSKAVLCFVYDDAEVSQRWESDYFAETEVAQLIEQHAIALKIDISSQEAKYLQALCPITQAPLVIVIKDGRIHGGAPPHFSKEAFVQMLQAALGGQELGQKAREELNASTTQGSSSAASIPSAPEGSASISISQATEPAQQIQPLIPQSNNSSAQSSSSTQLPPSAQPPATIQSATSGAVQTPPTPDRTETASPSKLDSQRSDYIAQQRQREEAQRAERQRIKESIEADRRERRRKAEASKRGETATSSPQSAAIPPSEIRLAVRLFSGESLRSNFAKSSTLASTIRPWIEARLRESSSSDVHTPYNFKLILSPQPSRTISIREEELTLEELLSGKETGWGRGGVNFVLVPEKSFHDGSYANAYITGGGGILGMGMRGVNAGYGLVSTVAGGVYGGLRTFLGNASPANNSANGEPASGNGSDIGSSGGNVKVRTLADQRANDEERMRQRRNELYNGNQTNFVPKPKKDDDSKDE